MSKRERYERANTRGGLGVRKRLSEESLRETYRLNGVPTGSAVARAHDKYFADFAKGYDLGILVRKSASHVQIHWLGDDDPTPYSQGDARYEVDRGRWKFLGPLQGNPLDPTNPLVDALTSLRQNAMMGTGNSPTPPTEETEDMAKLSKAAEERAAAKKQLETGELKERETYTAKQVATRCGTDSKTMRKFFRSNHSTVEPVGQGGRYEFDSRDFPKIKREFDAWQKKAKERTTAVNRQKTQTIEAPAEGATEALSKGTPDHQTLVDELSPPLDEDLKQRVQDHFGDDREPTDEELEAMAALEAEELDLDELDED